VVPAEDVHQLISANCQCPWSSVCEEEPVHLHIPEKNSLNITTVFRSTMEGLNSCMRLLFHALQHTTNGFVLPFLQWLRFWERGIYRCLAIVYSSSDSNVCTN